MVRTKTRFVFAHFMNSKNASEKEVTVVNYYYQVFLGVMYCQHKATEISNEQGLA